MRVLGAAPSSHLLFLIRDWLPNSHQIRSRSVSPHDENNAGLPAFSMNAAIVSLRRTLKASHATLVIALDSGVSGSRPKYDFDLGGNTKARRIVSTRAGIKVKSYT
jgi:hypothetical protein